MTHDGDKEAGAQQSPHWHAEIDGLCRAVDKKRAVGWRTIAGGKRFVWDRRRWRKGEDCKWKGNSQREEER
ncbi:hypothetical protein E2C01_069266 [Portunus trituberculatus]|uniref:Uncharacterized protein n=1 Tax=Portunus trituberculatus TaxID=210409 RepID=A0A5B7I057_PORTR|nr:hypothetical protein [Portunus trituberculatus]